MGVQNQPGWLGEALPIDKQVKKADERKLSILLAGVWGLVMEGTPELECPPELQKHSYHLQRSPNSSRTDTANMRFNQCHQETCVQPRRKASGRSSVLLGQSWKHLSDGDKVSMKQILLSCDIYQESRVILCLQACLRPFSVVITKPLEAGSFPPPS